jgi:hypothetical protein
VIFAEATTDKKHDHFCWNEKCLLHPWVVPIDVLSINPQYSFDGGHDREVQRCFMIDKRTPGRPGAWCCDICRNAQELVLLRGKQLRRSHGMPGPAELKQKRPFCSNQICLLHPVDTLTGATAVVDIMRPNGLTVPVMRRLVFVDYYRAFFFMCEGCLNAIDFMRGAAETADPALGIRVVHSDCPPHHVH